MKKCYLAIPLFITTISLSGCFFRFTDNGEWKKEYGTPELAINTVLNDDYIPRIYLYDKENQTKDEEYEIANYLLECAPFEEGKKKDNPVERYFTYEVFWQAATSGPNYCHLVIYDDGYLILNYKKSLGKLNSFYYSFNSSKALELVDLVFTKIGDKK